MVILQKVMISKMSKLKVKFHADAGFVRYECRTATRATSQMILTEKRTWAVEKLLKVKELCNIDYISRQATQQEGARKEYFIVQLLTSNQK